MKVLLLSGGLDSTVLFYDLLSHDESMCCVWIDYGQKNAREEQRAVQDLCQQYRIPLHTIFVPLAFQSIRSTLLKDVEGKHTVQSDELPNRNAVLISLAASFACTLEGQHTILVAAHKTGAAYADATPQFYTRMSKAIHWSTNSKVAVEAPYIRMTKRQIVRRAWDLAMTPADIMKTVSCYEGRTCGVCPACIARRRALEGTPFEQFLNK